MGKGRRKDSNTVYILGAGFSYDADVPLQASILSKIQEMDIPSLKTLQFPHEEPDEQNVLQESLEHQLRAITFVDKLFNNVSNPTLEDIFTLLDQCVHGRLYCYGYDWRELEKIRDSFYRTIVTLFLSCDNDTENSLKDFYRSVALGLISQRFSSGQDSHTFSVISLNWDCVLENAIYWCLERLNTTRADVDYCCYTYALKGVQRHKTSILQKAIGIFNIKVMKLHGSVNWFICPNCNRLYVGLGASGELLYEYTLGKKCPTCKNLFIKEGDEQKGPLLEPFIISPTFVKQFDNAHIQMIWHNAYMDLCRADKVVFIGYSLPEADYHLRTLLKRAIRPGTKIDVVLVKSDKALRSAKLAHIKHKYASSRYEAFFGGDKNVKLYFGGVKGYFSKQSDISIDDKINKIRAQYSDILNSSTLGETV